MQALKQMAITQARVLRGGISTWTPATKLVPGDVIILEAGNAVPADVRIIESVNLKIEEAALTGESHAIDKIVHSLEVDDLPVGDRKNLAFKGTFVTYGRGYCHSNCHWYANGTWADSQNAAGGRNPYAITTAHGFVWKKTISIGIIPVHFIFCCRLAPG